MEVGKPRMRREEGESGHRQERTEPDLAFSVSPVSKFIGKEEASDEFCELVVVT